MPEICVLGLGGSLGTIRSHIDTSVAKVKQTIARHIGIAPNEQRLIFDGCYVYGDDLLQIPEMGAEMTCLRRSVAAGKWMELARSQRLGKRWREAPDEVRTDPEIAFLILRPYPSDLKHFDGCLLRDRDFVLRAVSVDWTIIAAADAELRADPDIVLAAARKNIRALQYASTEFREMFLSDAEFAITALRQDPQMFSELAPELMADGDFVLRVVQLLPQVFKHVGATWQGNKEIALAAVSQRGDMLAWADKRLREDSDLARAATLSKRPSTAGIRLQVGSH